MLQTLSQIGRLAKRLRALIRLACFAAGKTKPGLRRGFQPRQVFPRVVGIACLPLRVIEGLVGLGKDPSRDFEALPPGWGRTEMLASRSQAPPGNTLPARLLPRAPRVGLS